MLAGMVMLGGWLLILLMLLTVSASDVNQWLGVAAPNHHLCP